MLLVFYYANKLKFKRVDLLKGLVIFLNNLKLN